MRGVPRTIKSICFFFSDGLAHYIHRSYACASTQYIDFMESLTTPSVTLPPRSRYRCSCSFLYLAHNAIDFVRLVISVGITTGRFSLDTIFGVEGGIRTLGPPKGQCLSRAPLSTTLPPQHIADFYGISTIRILLIAHQPRYISMRISQSWISASDNQINEEIRDKIQIASNSTTT